VCSFYVHVSTEVTNCYKIDHRKSVFGLSVKHGLKSGAAMQSRGREMSALRSGWFAKAGLAAIVMLGLQLASCAEDPKYPSLTKITDVDSAMTPEERQKALAALQKAQQTSSSDAEKVIQRSNQQ
jgi:hypothetical protein